MRLVIPARRRCWEMNNDRLRPVFLSKEQRLARKEAPPLEAPAERAAKPEHAASQGSLTDAEKSLIRAKYLGESLSKQTRQEKHDRKIRFAWDDTEDTTDSARPAAIPARASAKGPVSERLLHGSQHWSKKALRDMDSRDWRIFREDFNIRVQGTPLSMSDSCRQQCSQSAKVLAGSRAGLYTGGQPAEYGAFSAHPNTNAGNPSRAITEGSAGNCRHWQRQNHRLFSAHCIDYPENACDHPEECAGWAVLSHSCTNTRAVAADSVGSSQAVQRLWRQSCAVDRRGNALLLFLALRDRAVLQAKGRRGNHHCHSRPSPGLH